MLTKIVLLSAAVLGMLAGSVRAGAILGTSISPLTMSAGTTSGPMLVEVSSNNPPNDVMSAWIISLQIMPEGGAVGTLTFQDPATGTPPHPSGYIFGGNGLGIVAVNGGSSLNANDFFDPAAGPGAPVPGAPGANLLQMDFHALSGTSGTFGIYAVEGAASTSWEDSNFTTQFFTNVPNGTSRVLIGEVTVTPAQAVLPLPSSFAMGGIVLTALGVQRLREKTWRRHAGGEAGTTGRDRK